MALPAAGLISTGLQNTGTSNLVGGTALTNMVMRLFADFQKYLDPTETPFTSSLKTGKAVNQKKVEWGSSYLTPTKDDVGTGGIDTVATTLPVVNSSIFMVTDIIKVGTEHMWVEAIPSATSLTVRRAVGGTTAAAHLAGADINILGPAARENVPSPLHPVTKGALEYNLPQLFDYAVGLSERENNTPDYEFDSGSKYEAYLRKVMVEASLDFERTAILGRRREEVAITGATATPSMMGGLDFFTDDVIDLAGAAISETALNDGMQRLWERVGPENMAKDLLVGAFTKRAISSLFNANRIADVRDKDTTLVWKSIETDFGTMRFILSRYIPAGTAYLVNTKDITIHPYKNGAWKEVRLQTDGPYIKGRFTGDYTLVFRNNNARLKFTNISQTASAYPNI